MAETARVRLPTCDQCQEEFLPRHAQQRFCSNRCRNHFWMDRRKDAREAQRMDIHEAILRQARR